MNIVNESSQSTGPTSPNSVISATVERITSSASMSLWEDFRARISAFLDGGQDWPESRAASGESSCALFAILDPTTSSWRMLPHFDMLRSRKAKYTLLQ